MLLVHRMRVAPNFARSPNGPMNSGTPPEPISCWWSVERGSAINYAVPFLSPACAIARRRIEPLPFGRLFRAVGEIVPEFDHIADGMVPQGKPDDGTAVAAAPTSVPTLIHESIENYGVRTRPSALKAFDRLIAQFIRRQNELIEP